MLETPLIPVRPQILSLSEFLAALNQSFDKQGVRPCVLRNYEGFPETNVGRDIDFLIRAQELPLVIRAVRSIRGIRIVGYAERCYATHLYLEGVSATSGVRTLQVDFIWCLNWKGLQYLSTETVLREAKSWQAGGLTFLVPSPVHEAIISLLSSLLVGGWLREKYFPKIHQIFAGDRLAAITVLSPKFGLQAATRLVDSVIEGDRQRILNCVKPLRRAIGLRSFSRASLIGVRAVASYYKHEFALRYLPRTLETICILRQSDGGKTPIAARLALMLQYSAGSVEVNYGGRQSASETSSPARSLCASSDSKLQSRLRIAGPTIIRSLLDEWSRAFPKSRNLTLQINECRYDDSFIALRWHRPNYPAWIAHFMARITPSYDIWVLLDEHARDRQSKAPSAPDDELAELFEACSAFIKTRSRYAILNASVPDADITEEAYAAIVDLLTQRTEGRIKGRFRE